MTYANLLMYFNLFWSSEFRQQSSSVNNHAVVTFPNILYFCSFCVCGQKLWESCVIIPEMQSVLFSLETLFFVLRADIRQLQAFEKLSRGNEPWHLILRTSVMDTKGHDCPRLNLGRWPQFCLYPFPLPLGCITQEVEFFPLNLY